MIEKLGQVCQVGYVVKDIEKAMNKWVEIGVGPWFYAKKTQTE